MSEPALRTVSDTALLVAAHRARESDRRDRRFRDPYARALAGERGERIARQLAYGQAGWPIVVRTVFFDAVLTRLVGGGEVGCVLNLAAGLDSRPYRLDLPASLRWIEADLPELLEYKAARLAGERPRCALERMALDVGDPAARARVLDRTGDLATLVLTEGLLVYLAEEDVVALAEDLAARPNVRHWLLDLSGARALRWARRGTLGRQLADAGATHRFAPPGGMDFFRPHGWTPVEVRSSWTEARRLGRLPRWLRLLEAITPPDRRGAYDDIARIGLLERGRS